MENNSFLNAVVNNDINEVNRYIMMNDINFNEKLNNLSAIEIAINNDNVTLLRVLLDSNKVDYDSSLFDHILSYVKDDERQLQLFKLLHETYNLNINHFDRFKTSVLMKVVTIDDYLNSFIKINVPLMVYLLEHGADKLHRNVHNINALKIFNDVKWLINHQINIKHNKTHVLITNNAYMDLLLNIINTI